MKMNFITVFSVLLFTIILSSCSSTDKAKSTTKATPAVQEQEQTQKKEKQLTDAEKKALQEADLWLPAGSKQSSSTNK